MRTYVVLVEREVSTDVGDTAFVLLGFYEAVTAYTARVHAAEEHGIPMSGKVIAIPSKFWRAEE